MFHLITGVLMAVGFLYIYGRCISPLHIPVWLKAILAVVVCVIAFKLQIFRLIFDGSVTQEIPLAAHAVAGWLYAIVILWVLLSLTWDAIFVALTLWRKRRRTSSCTVPDIRTGMRVGLLLGAACVLATLGVWQALRVPDVHHVELRIPHLPPALDGLRIVQLSDMHISPVFRRDWVQGLVARVNALHPDLVVLTGDMVDGEPARRATDVAPLAWLKSRYGIYASLGNHEYYSGVEAWRQTLESLGICVLYNAHAVLPVRGTTLVLGGVTDPVAARFGLEEPSVERAFAGSPKGWRLLLAHQPRKAKDAADQGVGLQLSGHTHGGQLYPLSLLVGYFNEGYRSGLYSVGDMLLYVSPGAGLWGGFPVRLGAPAEITELVLLPEK